MSNLIKEEKREEETPFYQAAFNTFDWNHSGRIATSVSCNFHFGRTWECGAIGSMWWKCKCRKPIIKLKEINNLCIWLFLKEWTEWLIKNSFIMNAYLTLNVLRSADRFDKDLLYSRPTASYNLITFRF